MSYSHPSVAYRERAVRTASPAQLLVMVYDHVLANLARARVAYEKNLLEQRVEAIGRVLARHPGLFVTGSGFRVTGIPDCIADGRATARAAADFSRQTC